MIVCRTSGRARFSSSRNRTMGFPSSGNQYGGMNSVLPVASLRLGMPIKSPGSDIWPRNRGTTVIPFPEKYSVRISDLPIPWLPTSMIFWSAGVKSRSARSSVVLMFTFAIRLIIRRGSGFISGSVVKTSKSSQAERIGFPARIKKENR